MRKAKISVYDIVVIGMMVAALESAKLALSFLPNIELVTLLIILFTLTVGKKIYYAVFAFVVLEGLLYGFGIWWVMYLYMWPLLAWVTWLLRRKKRRLDVCPFIRGVWSGLRRDVRGPVSVRGRDQHRVCMVGFGHSVRHHPWDQQFCPDAYSLQAAPQGAGARLEKEPGSIRKKI